MSFRNLSLATVALLSSACLIIPIPAGSSGSGKPRSFNEDPPAAQPGSPPAGASPAAAGTSKPSTPAPMVPTSIEVHSDCPKTLPLFVGDKPKFGSGTKTSIGSNTTTTFPRKADGTASIWIIDDRENGVAQASVSPTTRRLSIAKNCTAITPE